MPDPDAPDQAGGPTVDGVYPRPQLVRPHWCHLGGRWGFAYDDDDDDDRVGTDDGWPQDGAFDRTITVPFPPESAASGIREVGFHPSSGTAVSAASPVPPWPASATPS